MNLLSAMSQRRSQMKSSAARKTLRDIPTPIRSRFFPKNSARRSTGLHRVQPAWLLSGKLAKFQLAKFQHFNSPTSTRQTLTRQNFNSPKRWPRFWRVKVLRCFRARGHPRRGVFPVVVIVVVAVVLVLTNQLTN